MRLIFSALFACLAIFCSGQNLSVMTYNIRLNHAGDGENAWPNRKEKLVQQLKFYEPDLFGIQEGLPGQVKYIDEALEDYAYIGAGRDDGKEKGEFSAIYYDENQFKLMESGTFWLSTTPERPSKGWDAALPRVCTYGLFKRNNDQQLFWLFNTHFDHIGQEARVNSMKLILNQIRKLNEDELPVILMGDFNVEPTDEPIIEMKKALRDSREIAQLVFGPEPTFNGFQFDQKPERRIDYIAVGEGIEVLKHAVLTDSYDQKYISDHFPVFTILSLNN